jgi:hypothetical protein
MRYQVLLAGMTIAVMTAGLAQAQPLRLTDVQLDSVGAGMSFQRLRSFGFDFNVTSSTDLEGATALADAEAVSDQPAMLAANTETETEIDFFSFSRSGSMAENTSRVVMSQGQSTAFGGNTIAGTDTRASLGMTSRAISSSFAASSGPRNLPR